MSLLLTLAAGVAGGWLGMWLGLPAGALVGSMVAAGSLRLLGGPVQEIPAGVRRGAQMVIGAALGVSFGWSQLMIGRMLFPALLLAAVLFSFSFVLAGVMVRQTGWSWSAALLSTAPAGMTELSLSADAMGLDASVVATIHLVRLTTVMTVVPWLVRWLG
ncbi:MAG: AbrB family transcriptional regulator [Armatimonadetes bacterium]|nr:AbrB family transcriptional regulator [Armatimonadota bacterium]